MDYNLSAIKKKVLNLVGRSKEDFEKDELLGYINRFYRFVMPHQFEYQALKSWYEFDTVPFQYEYDYYDNEFYGFNGIIFINGSPVNLFLDAERFYIKYPDIRSLKYRQPIDALLYAESLILAPAPDKVYSVKMSMFERPHELIDDDDKPFRQEWGGLIAYGAAIEILEDMGDSQRVSELSPEYERYKLIATNNSINLISNFRSIPSF